MLVGVLAAAFLVPSLWPSDSGESLTYTEWRTQVEDGQIATAEINTGSGKITGEFANGDSYSTTGGGERGVSEADEQLMIEQNVDYEFKPPSNNWLLSLLSIFLPVMLIIGFFIWMQRRASGQMGNVMSIGKSKAKAYDADKPSTTFDDIAGYTGVKQEITEVVDFLRMPERFKEIGARVPKGILLVGPPGTGKTLFARAVAGEAGVGFLSVTGSDFMEMFVGVGASRVRDLFQQARRMGRAIIFIDEIDSIGRKRGAGLGGGHDEREQTLNQLLAEMDGFETSEGIVIMAATNRPDILDPALLRPGRFDRQIIVPFPESSERKLILEVHSRDKRMGPDVDMETMAQATPGMSGADLANLVNEAALVAVRRGSKQIERIDFENARDRVVLGARRRVADHVGRREAGDRVPRGRPRLARHRAPPRRPAAQGHDPASRHGARCHLVVAAGASHVLQGVLRGHDLQGDGRPRRRDDRVRTSQLGSRQRPRTGHRHRPAHGPRMGHVRAGRPDGVEQPAGRVPRRGPHVVAARVLRRHGQAARRGDRPHPDRSGATGHRRDHPPPSRSRTHRRGAPRSRDDRRARGRPV